MTRLIIGLSFGWQNQLTGERKMQFDGHGHSKTTLQCLQEWGFLLYPKPCMQMHIKIQENTLQDIVLDNESSWCVWVLYQLYARICFLQNTCQIGQIKSPWNSHTNLVCKSCFSSRDFDHEYSQASQGSKGPGSKGKVVLRSCEVRCATLTLIWM